MNIYTYQVTDNKGNIVSMSDYEGKILLIVNTATQCGFTPQYRDLEALYVFYKDRGFEVLDFPCNQFGHQAPGNDDEISLFCEMRYQTTFPRFAKVNVNSKDAEPLFVYLKEQTGGFINSSIKWNFTKFLIGRDGQVIRRYSPMTSPSKIAVDIDNIL